jgi:hypothetical protein
VGSVSASPDTNNHRRTKWRRRKQRKAARKSAAAASDAAETPNKRRPSGSGLDARTGIRQFRQSWSSNYCGVYAAGILLSLLGRQTSREEAKRLFLLSHTNRDYLGASLDEVSSALIRARSIRFPRWRFFRRLALNDVHRLLVAQDGVTRTPTLIYFGIVHSRLGSKARHFSVITESAYDRLELLDPLAKPKGSLSNVSLVETQSNNSSKIQVIGCSYTVNTGTEAAVLTYTPRSSLAGRRRRARYAGLDSLDEVRD